MESDMTDRSVLTVEMLLNAQEFLSKYPQFPEAEMVYLLGEESLGIGDS